MTCECFYVIKDNSMESARAFVQRVKDFAEKNQCELEPVYISKVTEDFEATYDYDFFSPPYKVKKDELIVFVIGKYHNMVKFKGGRRGFPYLCIINDTFANHFEDIEKV